MPVYSNFFHGIAVGLATVMTGTMKMSDDRNRAAIEALVDCINRDDRGAMDGVFTDDVVMDWPQSGERIRGAANRREVYARFPSLPRVTPRRLSGSGNLWVLEANLDYGG